MVAQPTTGVLKNKNIGEFRESDKKMSQVHQSFSLITVIVTLINFTKNNIYTLTL